MRAKISIRLPKDLLEELKNMKIKTGKPLSKIIEENLRKALKK